MQPHPQLSDFLAAFAEPVQSLFWELRDFVLATTPHVSELIYDNYSALSLAYGPSHKLKDSFCHIAVYRKYVNLGFNRGTELTPGLVKLEGTGKLIRHIKVLDMRAFPAEEVAGMLMEAQDISLVQNETLRNSQPEPQSLVMSISEKKRR